MIRSYLARWAHRGFAVSGCWPTRGAGPSRPSSASQLPSRPECHEAACEGDWPRPPTRRAPSRQCASPAGAAKVRVAAYLLLLPLAHGEKAAEGGSEWGEPRGRAWERPRSERGRVRVKRRPGVCLCFWTQADTKSWRAGPARSRESLVGRGLSTSGARSGKWIERSAPKPSKLLRLLDRPLDLLACAGLAPRDLTQPASIGRVTAAHTSSRLTQPQAPSTCVCVCQQRLSD